MHLVYRLTFQNEALAQISQMNAHPFLHALSFNVETPEYQCRCDSIDTIDISPKWYEIAMKWVRYLLINEPEWNWNHSQKKNDVFALKFICSNWYEVLLWNHWASIEKINFAITSFFLRLLKMFIRLFVQALSHYTQLISQNSLPLSINPRLQKCSFDIEIDCDGN